MIYIILVVLIISGIFNGLSDRSKFHAYTLPKFLQGKNWWNTGNIPSWKLKYKDGDASKGEAFKFSTTLLVMVTDAHHFFKFLGILLFAIGLNVLVFYVPLQIIFYSWIVALAFYKMGFVISFK